MSKQLNLTMPWPGPGGILPPGTYAIPGQISHAHARCAVADGAGAIIVDETGANPGEAEAGKPASVEKARGAVPENKAGRGRRHPAEPA